MGTVGQKDTPSEDPSCLVVPQHPHQPALASYEQAAGCTSDLLLNRSHGPELAPQRPSVQVANAKHAPDSFGTIALRTKLATKVTDVKIDDSSWCLDSPGRGKHPSQERLKKSNLQRTTTVRLGMKRG
jgi:hypothetical protein